MKQPNTHHIRKLIDRAAGVGVGQSTAFTHKELVDISLGLNDLLLYQRELEQENRDLKEQIANSDKITVELVGDKF